MMKAFRQTQYVVHRWPCAGYYGISCPHKIMLDDIISTRKKRCPKCQHDHNKIRVKIAYQNRTREMKLKRFLEGNV